MLLRFRGPEGTVRITVEADETFGQLGDKVCLIRRFAYLSLIFPLICYSLSNSYLRTLIRRH